MPSSRDSSPNTSRAESQGRVAGDAGMPRGRPSERSPRNSRQAATDTSRDPSRTPSTASSRGYSPSPRRRHDRYRSNSSRRGRRSSSRESGRINTSEYESDRSRSYSSSKSRSRPRSHRHRHRHRRQRRYSSESSSGYSRSRDGRRHRRRSYYRMSNSPRHRRRHYSRHGRSESSYERSPDRRRDAASQPHRGADDVNGNAPTVLIKPGAPGGRYIPPAKLRLLMAEANLSLDKASKEYQRVEWDKLKKALNGNINKLNISNIKTIIPELIHLNLIRGRGLFCRAIMRAQAFSPTFTPVYAALVAVINTKLPLVGELLVTRLVVQFRKAFRRDQKALCLATTSFLAQLTNQRVCHELLSFQILQLLLENPTDDSIEVAVGFAKQIGALMVDLAPRVLNAIFETFRSVLHEAEIDKRVQYMIEVLFQIRRDQFKDYPIIPEGLDLVDEEEQIVHEVSLDDDELDVQEELNIFKYNPNYVEDEEKYAQIRREILGDSEGEEGGDEEGESGSEESVEDESDEDEAAAAAAGEGGEGAGRTVIRDRTEAELIHLRRTIYLTVMSSAIFEEAVHKLLKLDIQPGDEIELCNMIVECCAQERTYQVYYGLIGERLCKLNRKWQDTFVTVFIEMYENIHRFEVNRLRNIAKFFGFLFSTDALPWACFSCVKLTEEDTTSSSRIFLKQVLQDISEQMGLRQLNERIKAPELAEATKGLFPNDNTRHMRFAINYFTSIGLGALTEELREWLKEAVALKAAAQQESSTDYESDNGSDSSGNDSEDYSGSESPSHSTTSQPTRSASRSSSGSESSSGEDGTDYQPKSWRKRGGRGGREDAKAEPWRNPSPERRSPPKSSRRLSSPSSRSRSGRRVRSPSRTPSPSTYPNRGHRDRDAPHSRSPVRYRRRRSPHSYRRSVSPSRSRSPHSIRDRSRSISRSPISPRRRSPPLDRSQLSYNGKNRRVRSPSHSRSPRREYRSAPRQRSPSRSLSPYSKRVRMTLGSPAVTSQR